MTFNFNLNKQENKNNGGHVYDVTMVPSAFNNQQLEEITKFGDSLNFEKSQVGIEKRIIDNYTRRCNVAWFAPEKTPQELSMYLEKMIIDVNKNHYEFELIGSEAYQYTVYDSSNAGEYKWHIDTSRINEYIRKLSVSILLNDPSEFEGGKLLLNRDGNVVVAEERKGRAIFFPSWMPHCVTPVIKGTRKSLVIWCHGPKFK